MYVSNVHIKYVQIVNAHCSITRNLLSLSEIANLRNFRQRSALQISMHRALSV